ncbi:MAG TPA: hypothetical protein VMB18_19595 [Terriglobales bacterium]|nr:hypothetical protein [Terriglobales bacterium]
MPRVCRQCGANNAGNFLCLACGAPLLEARQPSAIAQPDPESPVPTLAEDENNNVVIATESSPEPVHDPSAEASATASNELAEDIRTFFESKPPVEPPPPARTGRYIAVGLLGLAAAVAGWHWRDLQAFAGKLVKLTPPPSAAAQPSLSTPSQATAETQPSISKPVNSTQTESSSTQSVTQEPAHPAPQVQPRRSRPKVQPASRITPVAETEETQGEKYLHGDGVPVDCDRAQKDLMAAAKHSSAKAETALGSMYANGHCAIRDLPLAYRWFARVQKQNRHTDPKIAADMQRLWNQMSPEERNLATR